MTNFPSKERDYSTLAPSGAGKGSLSITVIEVSLNKGSFVNEKAVEDFWAKDIQKEKDEMDKKLLLRKKTSGGF